MLHVIRQLGLVLLFCVAGATAPVSAQPKAPVVLAAASLQESLQAAASAWAAKGHAKPVLSFAASSALARQIEAGAPADLFISADEDWMNYLGAKDLIIPASRASFLHNRLALIAPQSSKLRLTVGPRFALARALGTGRLAIADPDSVPAGKYARSALDKLGVWPSVSGRLAPAENVRAALALVERGETPLGIVYATDAKASAKVKAIGMFPPSSHAPISYPLVRLKTSTSAEAEPFRRFLLSREGKAIFARYGFLAR